MGFRTNTDSLAGQQLSTQNVTIANGQSLSNAVTLDRTTLVGIVMPADWTAASMTFQASTDDTNFFDLFDNFGNEVIHLVNLDRYVVFDPSTFASVANLKVRSGTSGAAVNQAAERIIQILSRPL